MAPVESDDGSSGEEDEASQEGDEQQAADRAAKQPEPPPPPPPAVAAGPDGWADLMGDKIRLRLVSEGRGGRPEWNQDVRCSFSVRADGVDPGPVLQQHSDVRFRIGEGEAVPMLELGLRHMSEGARCELFGTSQWAWGAAGLRAGGEGEEDVPPDTSVRMEVTLHECLPVPSGALPWNEKIREVAWRKANGNDHFRRRQYLKARRCYSAAAEVFGGIFEPPEHAARGAAQAAASLVADCAANLAAVHLEESDPAAAKQAALEALGMSPKHVKSLFRLAKAHLALDELGECEAALRRVFALEPGNDAAKKLQFELARKKQQYSVRSKKMAERLFQGLHDERAEAHVPDPEGDWDDLGLVGQGRALLWAYRRWIGAGALLVFSFCLLLALLPTRHWKYLCIVYLLGGPTVAAVATAEAAEEGDRGKDAREKKRR